MVLRSGRLEGIVKDLLADDKTTFTCHHTFVSSIPDDPDLEDGSGFVGTIDYLRGEKMCAGAASYLIKAGSPSVGMRFAIHYGSIPKDHWDHAESLVIDPLKLNIND